MKEFLYEYFSNGGGTLSVSSIAMNFGVAFVIGLVIYLSYRFSHSGSVYSAKFNVSLLQLTLITTLVMNVIGNNIALSLGMVGALSIVRFRTAIKDSRDTAYIFWCIAVGICCGVSDYITAAIGTSVIFLTMLIFGAIKSNERYLLVIKAGKQASNDIEQCILNGFNAKALLRVKNTNQKDVEYIYEISSKILEKANKNEFDVAKALYKNKNVTSVNLICQNEEINR